jgi:hypothetical protein
MKLLSFAATVAALLTLLSISVAEESKQYVSTMGLRLVVAGAQPQHEDFVLVRIGSEDQKELLTRHLSGLIASDDMETLVMLQTLLQILDAPDYHKSNCYVLFSPVTDTITIGQPFHLSNDHRLIFEVVEAGKTERPSNPSPSASE